MLTALGHKQLQRSTPHWKRAQEQLRTALGEATWSKLGELLAEIARAGVEG
jgi:hypothetical protein